MTSAQGQTGITGQMLMAIEVGEKSWHLGFCRGEQRRERTIEAWDVARFRTEVRQAKKRLGLAPEAPVKCCYEAGRVGFSLYRFLLSEGIEGVILESSSIEVSRRARQNKTDGLDLGKMLDLMRRRFEHGEVKVFRQVTAPSAEEEAEMRLHRERGRLKTERTAHIGRIRSLLALHGIRVKSLRGLRPGALRDWSGAPLACSYQEEIGRELDRLALVNHQIGILEKEQQTALASPATQGDRVAAKLQQLKAVGPQSAWILGKEFFGWRHFKNRKQVGSMAGLVDCPYDSGESRRQQGISKAGNRRVRWVMIELAWSWLRYQPKSALSQWWGERFACGGKRRRRTGIVALARKLLIALWKYVELDETPQGAALKAS